MRNTIISFIALLIMPVLAFAQTKDLSYFRDKINTAYQSGSGSVTLDAGTYYLDILDGDKQFFLLDKMHDFTINAPNTKFVFTSGNRAFTISNCNNVGIDGLTIDYWPLPFTQGTVTSFNGEKAIVAIHAGYAGQGEGMTATFRDKAYIIEADSKKVKDDTFSTGSLSEVWLDNRNVQISITKGKNQNNLVVGDRLVFFYTKYGGSGHTVYLENCSNTTFTNLTINASIGRAFLEATGLGNTHYTNVKVTYGEKPNGASEERLFTSVAAGIRCIGLDVGLKINNSLFEGLGDDGLNLQGDYFLIFEKGDNYINIASKRDQYFEVNDTLICVNSDGVEVGMARLTGITNQTKPLDFETKRSHYLSRSSYNNSTSTFNDYYRFNFEGELNAEEGNFIYNINKVGAGFKVENSTYRNIRARGIIIKAPNGVVRNNHIENITQAGIMVAPEIHYWLESGSAKNVLISENTVKRTNFRPQIKDGTQSAAIVVSSEGEDMSGNVLFTPGIIHSNIIIDNNTIKDIPGPGILVSSTQNVQITNNGFENTNNWSNWQSGVDAGVDVKVALYVTQTDTVYLWGNKLLNQGANRDSDIFLSETVTHVFGEFDGVDTSIIESEIGRANANCTINSVYPNPFNKLATIKLGINKAGYYNLNIYDISSIKVKSFDTIYLPIGEYEFIWQPNESLNKGMYLCLLSALDTMRIIDSKKLIYRK
ncbi:right-handed parallel beta-helix repeat-containing protein [Labilibacter sediminis]|nr:right-handed parallel beta-helix repeat-containing protein [Labilibacter sediminis]